MKKLLPCTGKLMVALSLAVAFPSFAEDIDLYAGAGGGTAAPNVLFFLDNTSNWSASNQRWSKSSVDAKCDLTPATAERCREYSTAIFAGASTLEQGRIELRALKLVLNKLVCSEGAKVKINAGLMMFALANKGTADGSAVTGGYIRQRVASLDSSRCPEFIADLDTIDAKITENETKTSSSAGYGAALYEAFKYFGGWTNPSGSALGKAGSEMIGIADSSTRFGPMRYVDLTGFEDSLAFTNNSKNTYKSPISGTETCGNNYIVLIGNTWPNADHGTDTNNSPHPSNTLMTRLGYNPGAQIYPRPLPNNEKTNVRFGDEWTKFLYDTDVSSAPGIQNIRTFAVDVYNTQADAKQSALLKSMADQSGAGGYFSVGGDLYKLIAAFTDILTQIASVDSVFASASLPVSVNAQGTFLNQVFMGVFRPEADAQQRWAGNLKQYQFGLTGNNLFLSDADGELAVDEKNTGFVQHCARSFWTSDEGAYWETITGFNRQNACEKSTLSRWSDRPDGPIVERGGAGQRLRIKGHAGRNIKSCETAACASLVDFNTTTMTPALDPALTADFVNWVRGQNTGDGNAFNNDLATYGLAATATRPTVHGAVIHSRPLAVNYGSNIDDVVVFFGADDGVLRAINGSKGTGGGDELWAFVAPEHWSTLQRARTNKPLIAYPNVTDSTGGTPTPKSYYFDGSIGGYQERSASGVGKLWIYPTMRRGGRSVYAFNVTAKPSTSTQPTLMWRYNEANNSNMGQSWSTPTVIRVKGTDRPLAVFGAGYDSCEDAEDPNTACAGVTRGRGIVVTDAESGTGGPTANNRFIDPGSEGGRFMADITPVDVDGDGFVDVLYAVDTRGNIWRINTSNPAAGFSGYTGGAANWPINRIASVAQWGGSLAERRKFQYAPSVVVLNTQVTVLVGSGDREKPIASSNAAKVRNRFYGIRDNVTVTSSVPVAIGYGVGSPDLVDLKNVTGMTGVDTALLAPFKGWFTDLSSTTEPYEQVVTTPLTLAGVTYFSTFRAKGTGSDTTCTDLGSGRGYRIDFQTGSRLANEAWVTNFVSTGIPPSPVGGLVTVGDRLVPFCIGCAGPTPLSPTKITPKIRADRKPIYRYQRIDR